MSAGAVSSVSGTGRVRSCARTELLRRADVGARFLLERMEVVRSPLHDNAKTIFMLPTKSYEPVWTTAGQAHP